MAERSAVIMHVTLGEPEVGLWCEACALPSLVRFPLYGISELGVWRLGRNVNACTECSSMDGG